MDTADLRRLRSEKELRLRKVCKMTGLFAKQDASILREQMSAIDAILSARTLQQTLF